MIAVRRRLLCAAAPLLIALLLAACGAAPRAETPSASLSTILATSRASPTPAQATAAARWFGIGEQVRSEVVYSNGAARCTDAWRFEFSFTETGPSSVRGEGTATLTSPMECQPAIGGRSPLDRFRYRVEGERRGERFTLRFVWEPASGTVGVGMVAIWDLTGRPRAPLTIETAGDFGSADARWTYSHRDPTGSLAAYEVEGKFEVACDDC